MCDFATGDGFREIMCQPEWIMAPELDPPSELPWKPSHHREMASQADREPVNGPPG